MDRSARVSAVCAELEKQKHPRDEKLAELVVGAAEGAASEEEFKSSLQSSNPSVEWSDALIGRLWDVVQRTTEDPSKTEDTQKTLPASDPTASHDPSSVKPLTDQKAETPSMTTGGNAISELETVNEEKKAEEMQPAHSPRPNRRRERDRSDDEASPERARERRRDDDRQRSVQPVLPAEPDVAASHPAPGTSPSGGQFIFGQNLNSRVTNAASGPAPFSGFGGFAALAQTSFGTGFGGFSAGTAAPASGFLFAQALQSQQPKTPSADEPDTKTEGAVNGKAKAGEDPVEPHSGSSLAESARIEYAAKNQKPLFEEVDVVTGEEGEYNVFETSVKLYGFDAGAQQWKERGRAAARLNDADDGTYSRLVVRMAGTLRIIINMKLWKDMVVKRMSERSVSFSALDAADGQLPKVFLIACSAADAETFHSELSSRVEQLRTEAPLLIATRGAERLSLTAKGESGLDRSDTSLEEKPHDLHPPKKPKRED